MTTPQFRRWADMVADGLVVKPFVEEYLRQGRFPERFDVTFLDEGQERKPDGFFHPSTHPLWGERLLFYYLTQPDKMIPELIAYENRMALVMGSAAHSFVQMCMYEAALLLRPTGTCQACGRTHGTGEDECPEWGAIDKDLGRRGHLDGILTVKTAEWGRGLLEFKTVNPRAAYGFNDGDVAWIRAKRPEYYAQVQDYLDMTGMANSIMLFLVPSFPFRLIEVAIPYDHGYVTDLRAKYRRVREAEASGTLPDPCCAPRSATSKTCPARGICPIAAL